MSTNKGDGSSLLTNLNADEGLKVTATLTGYQLREKSGLRRNFYKMSGDDVIYRLASIEDAAGNRVTFNYEGGRLTSIRIKGTVLIK